MNYTAHRRQIGEQVETETVIAHMQATADFAVKYAKGLGAEHIVYLAAYCHDAGKLTKDFDDYINERNQMRRGEIDHSFGGAKYIYECAEQIENEDVKEVAHWIAHIIISHHGLHDWLTVSGNDYFMERVGKIERYDEIYRNMKEILPDDRLTELLYQAGKEYGAIKRRICELAKEGAAKSVSKSKHVVKIMFVFYMGMLERLLQSILVDADRTATTNFMTAAQTERDYDMGQLWHAMAAAMDNKCEAFAKRTDDISVQRTDISNRCMLFAQHPVKACRLIVPTGGGKTLSSLRFAIAYCLQPQNGMKKIIYVAPFMSILEQNSDEIKQLLGTKYQDCFLEHYSNIIADIASGEKNSKTALKELDEYELRCDKWDAPIIATTLVQFLNTLFRREMSSVRRMNRLQNAVIIFDEVQSIPVKCVYLFNLAVNFLTHICGCTVVLCSATQPSFDEAEYPLLLDEEESMSGDYSRDFEVFKRTKLINQMRDKPYSDSDAADFCYERFVENGNLLVVVNTKRCAKELYQKLQDKNGAASEEYKAMVVHLSTNMSPQHRRNVLQELRKQLDDGKRVICVTTQLIEAGVDISFHCVVRSYAGLDNIVQAAGRCNRNGERDICCVYVINIDEKLTKLKEIRDSRDIAGRFIWDKAYQDRLIEPGTLRDFFRRKYHECRKEMEYEIKDGLVSSSILQLLSLNSMRSKQRDDRIWNQAFATAGEKFRVIDTDTIDILVPSDEEAENIILRLNSERPLTDVIRDVKLAQKYTVSVYSSLFEALREKNAIYELHCGRIFALRPEFYHNELGVIMEGTPKELLYY